MTVLFDLTSLADHLSGMERFAMNISFTYIKKNTQNHYVLVFKDHVDPLFEKIIGQDNVIAEIIPACNKLLFSQFLLPLHVAKYKVDYYIFLAFPAPFMFFKKNAISAIHDMGCWDCPQTMKKIAVLYYRILFRKAVCGNKRIITVSEFSKGRIHEILGKNNEEICVVNCAVADKFQKMEFDETICKNIRKKYGLPERYVLTLSTMEPRKNMRLLAELFLKSPEFKQFNLVIAGRKGWLVDDLFAEIESQHSKNIFVTGFVNDDDLPYLYNMADIFVFPSLYEGFGLPPLEAMACGCSVISSDAASMPEILGEDAIFFKNNSLESLKKKLLEWENETEHERTVIKKRAIKRARQYTWENSELMLEKVIGN